MGAPGTQPGPKSRAPARAGAGQGKKAPRSETHMDQPPGADHVALGTAALQMRRAKRFDEALDLYRQATAAAKAAGDAAAHATWTSKQGNIHRLLKNPVAAERAYQWHWRCSRPSTAPPDLPAWPSRKAVWAWWPRTWATTSWPSSPTAVRSIWPRRPRRGRRSTPGPATWATRSPVTDQSMHRAPGTLPRMFVVNCLSVSITCFWNVALT